MPLAVYRELHQINKQIIFMVALPQIQCQLHDHARQYDNDEACHNKWNGGKLHGNISWNGCGNAIIGRYGGCFEEDIRRFMCDRAYHITGFGCTGEFCTNSRGEKGQCTVPKRLAMMERWECVQSMDSTLVIKNSHTYCKNLQVIKNQALRACS